MSTLSFLEMVAAMGNLHGRGGGDRRAGGLLPARQTWRRARAK